MCQNAYTLRPLFLIMGAALLMCAYSPSNAHAQDAPNDETTEIHESESKEDAEETPPGDVEQEPEDEKLGKIKRLLHNRAAFKNRPDRDGISDAVYDRPFVLGGQSAAIGGYAEAGGTWTKEDGDILGTNFFLRRFNLFVYARVLPKIEFIAELEWENGGTEIGIETAQFDIELAPWLTLRAGVMLIPLGGFNQAHDAPKWPFVDRPLVSTTIIPSTFSGVGAALVAEQTIAPGLRINAQAYLTNGLGHKIVGNATGRVDIPSGKHDKILDEDNNGRPAISGRVALLYNNQLEFGISAYHTAYNNWFLEGETYGPRRHLTIGAVDLRARFWRLEIRGEAAMAWVDVPEGMRGIYANKQFGWYLDVYGDLWKHTLGTGVPARLRLVLRGEQADYYVGPLAAGRNGGDSISGFTVGFAWEVNHQIVFRGAVRNRWTRDILNNPAERSVQVQLGVASYF